MKGNHCDRTESSQQLLEKVLDSLRIPSPVARGCHASSRRSVGIHNFSEFEFNSVPIARLTGRSSLHPPIEGREKAVAEQCKDIYCHPT